MNEEWRDIEGYNGKYQVSNLGHVRSFSSKKKGDLLAIQTYSNGYKYVELSNGPNAKKVKVHRLVSIAFIQNPNNYPFVNHLDGHPNNNLVSNLEWCNQSQNVRHAFDVLNRTKPMGELNASTKLTDDYVRLIYAEILTGKYTQRIISKKFNVPEYIVQHIKVGKDWTHVTGINYVKGSSRPSAKLSAAQAKTVYKLAWDPTVRDLDVCKRFKIHPCTVSRIKHKLTWKSVTS